MKVSVMMPARNTEKYIREAIESIFQQTYTNWEIIVINDKSSDNTADIVNDYVLKDSRVKLYEGAGIGVANARNKAIDFSTGDYIMLMDSDDVSVPTRIEKLMGIAVQQQLSVVGSNVFMVDSKLGVKNKSFKPISDSDIRKGFKRFWNRCTIIPGTILAPVCLFKQYRYNEFYKILSDWDFILRMSANPNIFFRNVEEPLYYYRVNDSSITLSNERVKYNLLLRYNEFKRQKGKDEIKSIKSFEQIIQKNIILRLIYTFFYILKKLQHMKLRLTLKV